MVYCDIVLFFWLDCEFVAVAPYGEVAAVFEEFFAGVCGGDGTGGVFGADVVAEVVDCVCQVGVLPEWVGSGAVCAYDACLVFDCAGLEECLPRVCTGLGP